MRCSQASATLFFGGLLTLYGVFLITTSNKLLDDPSKTESVHQSLRIDSPNQRQNRRQHRKQRSVTNDVTPLQNKPFDEPPKTERETLSENIQKVELQIITEAPKVTAPPAKFITFQRNGGRMNNQWFSLVAAIMMATQMNRTLLVPPEVHPHERTGMFEPELEWWDLDSLFENYSLEFVMDPKDQRLNVTDPACKGEHQRMYDNFDETKRKFENCPIVDMGGKYGLLQKFCGPDQRLAFEIYSHFRPGPVIRNLIDQLPHYPVAVHSRTHGGPEAMAGDGLTICKSGLMRTAKANLKSFNLEEVYGQCYFNDTLLHELPDEPFILAHDGMLDFETHYGDRAVTVSSALQDPGLIGEKTGVLAALVELFSLVRADYFYGMIYSTFALSVCMLRGEDRKYDSNVCWALMHADSHYAEPPKSDYKRLGCMVPLGSKHNTNYYEIIRATWGKRCDILRFFPDTTFDAYEEFGKKDDVVFLPMVRKYGDLTCPDGQPCRHIWEKMWRLWVWVEENLVDYFLKIDTDAYFVPENARDYLKDMMPEDDLYAGHALYDRNPTFVSGICTIFSRGTIRKLGNKYRNMPSERDAFERGQCADRAGANEDLTTAMCLKQLGVYPTAARDGGREKFLPFNPHAHLGLKKPEKTAGDWFWGGKPDDVGEGKECCSLKPIALHGYKDSRQLFGMENTLYGDETNLKVEEDRNVPHENAVLQRDYFQQVQQGVDRTRRLIIGDSRMINVKVFLSLCYYMPFDDLLCDPVNSWERQYTGTIDAATAARPYDKMKEAERWAHHRQPWIVNPSAVNGDLNAIFPTVRPYRVVGMEGEGNVESLRQRFGNDMLVVSKVDFLDRKKCEPTLRQVLYHWDLPYSRDAVIRACRETQAGQMTSKMMRFLGKEASIVRAT